MADSVATHPERSYHPSVAVAPARSARPNRGIKIIRHAGADGSNWIQQLQKQSTSTQVLIGLGSVAAIAGIALLLRRAMTNAATRRAVQRALLPPPAACSYVQLRVEAGSGNSGIADSYAQYQAALKTARATVPEGSAYFAYIGAANVPETGSPWCGDCRAANPVVHAAFQELGLQSTPKPVLVATFVDRPSWKDSEFPHPLKTDAELHLQRLPTLFRFVHGVCVGQLVEGDCTDAVAVEAFIRKRE